MLNKLAVMTAMQFTTNAMVSGKDWPKGKNDYLLAAGMESVEIIDGVGWKWWKHTERADATQLNLELVDIWHFLLGEAIRQHYGDLERTNAFLLGEWSKHKAYKPEVGDTRILLKRFTASCFSDILDIRTFISVCSDMGLTFGELYRLYIIKNTLVKFRSDHDYNGEGYIKSWDGKEDNVHLIEQAALLDDADPEFVENLYDALVKVYPGNPLVGA